MMSKPTIRPSVRDPFEILLQDHAEFLKHLIILKNATDNIKSNGFSYEAFEEIAESAQYIDKEIREHNLKEEKYLFPLIERHVDGPPNVMMNEHRELWRAFKTLTDCVKEIEDLHVNGTSVPTLIRTAHYIVSLLEEHMRKENDVLFPMAKRVLTPKEYQQLMEDLNKATVS